MGFLFQEFSCELWVRDFYRKRDALFLRPQKRKNGVVSGELYTMQDILLTAWWGSGNGQCWYCGGSGRCPACGGSGRVTKWVLGTREYLNQSCTDCYSPGKCRICRGSGK